MNKVLLILFVASCSFSCCLGQERTSFRGDTTPYKQIRLRIKKLTDSIKRKPDNEALLFRRAELYYNVEDWTHAESDLSTLLTIAPTNFMYYYKRGATKDRLEQLSDAYEDFDKAILLNPNFEYSYFDRGLVLSKLRLLKRAEADFRSALKLKLNMGPALFSLGANFEDENRLDSAKPYYVKAIEADNTLYKGYNNLASIFIKEQQYQLAIDQCDKALKIWDKYTFALINRARAKYLLGDQAGACADLASAIKLGSENQRETYNSICK